MGGLWRDGRGGVRLLRHGKGVCKEVAGMRGEGRRSLGTYQRQRLLPAHPCGPPILGGGRGSVSFSIRVGFRPKQWIMNAVPSMLK